MAFPKDFVWGVATSSYQIEGISEGRGECIWTRFSRTPGKVLNGDTGDVACDHVHRYREDVALMKELGVPSYRFSTSWPRVLPNGVGATNSAGLEFYDRLVDELLRHGIQPWLTLYHWDLPQALQDQGGWANPDSVQWFVDYAELMARRLGDRVKNWITHNEPWCASFLSNMFGEHAPGLQDPPTAYKVAHHLLLSHGHAVPVIRQHSAGAQVGITLNLSPQIAAGTTQADRELERQADGLGNRWFLDPVFKGVYPADMVKDAGSALDGIDLEAVKIANVPTDFLGINYYMRYMFAADPSVPGVRHDAFPPNAEFTQMGWEVYPQGMADMLIRVTREYGPKAIYITENGAAYPDPEPVNGIVEDPQRVSFYRGYLSAAESAIAQGAPLKGYFAWSLLDNFEWAWGYDRRFGIVHVDFKTQKRSLKRSALYLRDVMRTGKL